MSFKRSSSSKLITLSEDVRARAFIKKQKRNYTNPISSETGISNCMVKIAVSMYCCLAPMYLNNPIEGIKKQHLDNMIMKYNNDVNGIILGYENLKFIRNEDDKENEQLFKVTPDTPFSFIWCSVDFIAWTPQIGDIIEGWIFIQSASHIGILIHDAFNASVKKNNIPESWTFVHNEDYVNNGENSSNNQSNSLGYWVDENGQQLDGKIKFAIRNIFTTGKLISLDGTLLTLYGDGSKSSDININANTGNDKTMDNQKNMSAQNLPVVSNKKIVFDDEVSTENRESHKELDLPKIEKENGEEVVYEDNASSSDNDSDKTSSDSSSDEESSSNE
ncbi:related to DNA-directed RNA polymerase I subunit RPA43 [Saccharomycodes ludwigii]|uniref:DNA-directed RNA polymerase subunit n=1 Tax=Saccharomycodes ludwigii TaxID=36035 RepID=A0A376B2J3_9ASCO|nr:hypothetical protein SCDLUD_000455 [Saccharomycodes ludwigii]KAH3902861.1 hypothetical protein SCDLUD_000455 [Saccharomycodes ludwigii]SSD58898.1 related to DNA-directed RNA polymerase I subunit RPA43 [Saccharomycodes ludwigii]